MTSSNNIAEFPVSEQQQQQQPISFITENPLPSDSMNVTSKPHIPSVSASAVLGESMSMPDDTPRCLGFDFNKVAGRTTKKDGDSNNNSEENSDSAGADNDVMDMLMKSMKTTGFQATNIGLAIDEINKMRSWRLSDVPYQEGVEDPSVKSLGVRKNIRCKIFLAYTSNQISSGQREVIRYLVEHKLVDVIITTAGGIEEDLIKCFQPTFMGDFKLNGKELRKKGINRIGNLLIPNKNYCQFEDWLTPLIEQMHNEQDEKLKEWLNKDSDNDEDRFVWTPSKFINRLGKEINNESSVLYWAYKNNIPVFCPALTDGSVGDMLYFHSYKRSGFVLDIAEDIRKVNDEAVQSHCTGQIILGGGLVKHHCCNANLMRNGANYSVYVNTGQEFDGSDSGASPDEAVSWGKIRITATPVKVSCDATIAFPLIVSQTFAKNLTKFKEDNKNTVCWLK